MAEKTDGPSGLAPAEAVNAEIADRRSASRNTSLQAKQASAQLDATVDAVIKLARRFGPIWPQTPQKTGYRGTNGSRDASRDEQAIRGWWQRHPEAVPALMTGQASGVVGLDIDVKNGRNGLDALEQIGVVLLPPTPTAHTPSGGLHLLFRWPGHHVPTTQDKIGPGLEVKGDGAWITLPPGPGRSWDQHLCLETSLAEMPVWMMPQEPVRSARSERNPRSARHLSAYAEAALDDAVKAISTAVAGEQHAVLNRECFSIGQLVGGGGIPAGLARDALMWAARAMPSHDARRPWREPQLRRQVEAAFLDGLDHPREVP